MRSELLSKQKSEITRAYQTLANQYSEFLPLASDLKKALELTMLKVTGSIMEPENYPTPEDDTLDKLLHSRLVQLNDRKRDYASYQFLAKRKYLEFQREHPKFIEKNWEYLERLQTPQSIFTATKFTPEHDFLNTKSPQLQFFQTLGNNAGLDWFDGSGRPPYDQLALRIHNIICLDETNIESTSDRIGLSALVVETEVVKHRLSDGTVHPIEYHKTFRKPIVTIGQGIGDGWEMRPNPYPWYYHIFDIWNPSGYDGFPKYRGCDFFLAELDNGGFDEFLEEALKKITAIVVEAVAAYIGKKIGEKVAEGFLASVFGSLVGGVIGALASYLLSEFIELIVEWWKDDVFPPQPAGITVPSFQPFLKYDGLYSELRHCDFQGHGGHYRLEYSWQLLSSANKRAPSLSEGYTPVTPATRGATIFTNVMYDGQNKFLRPGSHSLAERALPSGGIIAPLNSFDKQVDSIKIDPGIAVFAYKSPDFTGEHLYLQADAPWLDDAWRDTISSLVVVDLSIPH